MIESICPICTADRPVPFNRQGRDYLSCRTCHYLWRPGGASLEETTSYYRAENPTDRIGHAKLRLYMEMLERGERQLQGPGRLLDVGCSRGDFLRVASDRGWEVVGIEPVASLANEGRARGFEIHTGQLADFPPSGEHFDLITYWDVLFLIDDPISELQRAVMLLSPRGMIFLRLRQHRVVRAMDQLWSNGGRLLVPTNPAVYHPGNYEPRTMRYLGQRLGLQMDIRPGRLTVGDPYQVAPPSGFLPRLKQTAEWTSRTLFALSGNRLVISPTMDVWCRVGV